MKKIALSSFHLKNFKAVRNSGRLKLTPLTAFIGHNGSGKSSLVEALETVQTLVLQGLDQAMIPWHGFEYIHNRAKGKTRTKSSSPGPMSFSFQGRLDTPFKAKIEISADEQYDHILVTGYKASTSSTKLQDRANFITEDGIIDPSLKKFVTRWQFLRLDPDSMTEPLPQRRSVKSVRLNSNGSNIAEYLLSIRDMDMGAFDGIIETLKVVLPYALDIRPAVTSELDRKVYLTLAESNIDLKLPSWLLSTGTLRILALLAVLRHPVPPPLLVIEEIENGLDPRTIQLLVEEMRYFVESGLGQIIITTHSPYFLDLLTLSQIVVVERNDEGAPQFIRPDSKETLEKWGRNFAPGKLYTMGALSRKDAL
jgi:predicted ATPase